MENKKDNNFSESEIENFVGLYHILSKIHKRLVVEGKVRVENGKSIKFID